MQTRTIRFLTAGLVALSYAARLGAADWPDFRGRDRDGRSSEAVAASLPPDGPRVVWERPVGAGFSNPIVVGGRVLIFHRLGESETLEALKAETGEQLWKTAYPTAYHDDFGFDEGPRASPVAAGGQIYTFGAQGVLTCYSLASGNIIWQVDANREFGVEKGYFGAASTPLIDGRRLLLNLGGADSAGIVAFDKDTGKLLWRATDDGASYSSPVLGDFGAQRVVFFTREGAVLLDSANGAVVWRKRWRARSNASVNAAMPVVAGAQLFLTASYGTGAIALRWNGEGFDELWSGEDALSAHYASPVELDSVLYGFHGRQEYGPSFRAVEMADGKVLWSEEGFGAGTVLLAGKTLVILRENGELVLAPASRSSFQPQARAQLLPGEVRAYPAIADGKLYARDESTLIAVELETR